MLQTIFHPRRLLGSLLLCWLLLFPAAAQAATPPVFSHHTPRLAATLDWQTLVDVENGFRVAIPKAWQLLPLSAQTLDVGLEAAGANDPRLESLFGSPTFRQMLAGGMKFYAIDLTDGALEYDLPPNINIVKLDLGADLPMETLQKLNKRQLRTLAEADYPINSQIVTVQGQSALLFQYVLAFDLGLGQPQLTQIHQLLVPEKGDQYIVTVGVPLVVADEYGETVAHMLDSFQLMTFAAEGENATQPSASPVVAVVETNNLNVRSGPGTGYAILGRVTRGDRLIATARNSDCSWVEVQHSSSQSSSPKAGWIAAKLPYATVAGECLALPLKNVPPPPPSSAKGCMLFQNNINAELTITFTSKDGKWNETFKVGRKAQHRHCFTPDEYTFTVDAPPPWESYNDRVIIPPGANILHPVNPG